MIFLKEKLEEEVLLGNKYLGVKRESESLWLKNPGESWGGMKGKWEHKSHFQEEHTQAEDTDSESGDRVMSLWR